MLLPLPPDEPGPMRVTGTFNIQGRGVVATVKNAPPTTSTSGVLLGSTVCQGSNTWTVVGIEKFLIFVPQTELGLLLRPTPGSCAEPEIGCITHTA